MSGKAFGSEILDAAAGLLAPFIVLFALYVLFHGHHSPGGGFQAGTLLASAVILIRLVRGDRPGWRFTASGAAALAASGVLLYAGIGFAAMPFGGNFLDYASLPWPLEPARARALGILGIEIGVAAGVLGTLLLIFDRLDAER